MKENYDGLVTNKKGVVLSITNADCTLIMLYDSIKGIICTTTTQYDVEPIYSHTNGWSVIKNQF